MQIQHAEADGACFVIQNTGLTALGANGGGLGYQNINNSVAIDFKTYNGNIQGFFSTKLLQNGAAPGSTNQLNGPLGLGGTNSTFNLRISVSYDGTNLSWNITNTDTALSVANVAAINIPSVISSNTAWVGFSAGSGALVEKVFVSYWKWGPFGS